MFHWALDGDGSLEGGSGEGSLRVVGGSWLDVGRVGGGVRLDGEGFLDVGGIPPVSGASGWSLGLWVRRQGSTAGSVLFSPGPGGGKSLLLEAPFSPGRLGVGQALPAVEAEGGIDGSGGGMGLGYGTTAGRWVHLVFTGSSEGVSMYADGVFAGRVGGVVDLPLSRVGAGVGGAAGVVADLDDLRLWGRALSSEEVAGVFSAFPPPPTPPGAPSDVSVSPGADRVVLRWDAPVSDGGRKVSGYGLRYQAAGGSWSGWVLAEASSRARVLAGLEGGRVHRFQVRARNALGWGSWVEAAAAPGRRGPPGSPREVRVSPGRSGLRVFWSRPGTDGGSAVSGYEVRWRASGEEGSPPGDWSVPARVGAGVRSWAAWDLAPDEGAGYEVEVQVRAVSGVGAGRWAGVAARLGDPAPPGAPRGLSVLVEGDAATLSWLSPGTDGGSEVSGYEVRWRRGPLWSRSSSAAAADRGCEFSGLVRGEDHEFMVRAVNPLGAGPWASVGVGVGLSGDHAPTVPRLQSWSPGTGVFTLSERSRVIVAADDGTRHRSGGIPGIPEAVLGGSGADSGSERRLAASAGAAVDSGLAVSVFTSSRRSLDQVAHKLAADIWDQTGLELPVVGGGAQARQGDIVVGLSERADTALSVEGYELELGPVAAIASNSTTGVFWGSRTLLQLLRGSGNGRSAPSGRARDWPSAQGRIRMVCLDTSARRFGLDELKLWVRHMSWYKMNALVLSSGLGADGGAGLSAAEISELEDFAGDHHVALVSELAYRTGVPLLAGQGNPGEEGVPAASSDPLSTPLAMHGASGAADACGDGLGVVSFSRWPNGHLMALGSRLVIPDAAGMYRAAPSWALNEVGTGVAVGGTLAGAASSEFLEGHLHRPLAILADRSWNPAPPPDSVEAFLTRLSVIGLPPGQKAPEGARRATGGGPIHHWAFDEYKPLRQNRGEVAAGQGWLVVTDRVGSAHGFAGGAGRKAPAVDASDSIAGDAFWFGARPESLDKDGVELAAVDIPAPWTLSAWVKRTGGHPGATLLSSVDAAIQLEQHDQPGIGLLDRRSEIWQYHAFDYALPLWQWIHLVLVADDTGTKLYANGVMVGAVDATVPLPLKSIGFEDAVVLKAKLDEMRVWDRALSPDQIRAIQTYPADSRPGPTPEPIEFITDPIVPIRNLPPPLQQPTPAVEVTLSGGGTVSEASGVAELEVVLGRALAADETVEVPLAVSGVSAADFSLALKAGVGVNTGVALADAGSLAPRVTLSGAGSRAAVLVFTAVQDDVDEGVSETAVFTLGDLAAGAPATNVDGGAEPSDDGDPGTADNTVEVTITDDDDPPPLVAQFASAAYAAGEASGSRSASVVVSLSPAPSAPVDVSYTVGGTAVGGDDYTALAGTVRVGVSGTAVIAVTVVDDSIDEADETVVLTLQGGSGYEVGSSNVTTLTITDDDGAPTVSLRLGSASVSESGSAVAVTATLDRVSDVDVVLAVAAAGAGFTLSGSALTVAAGQTASTGEVSITPVDDNVDNADRDVTVTATVTAGRGVTAPAPVVLAITDDDGAPSVSLSVASPSVAESGSAVAVTATLSRASDADVVLTVALQGAGAVLSANKALTITAGQTASSGAAVTVIPADDDADNADREVTVTAAVTAGRGVAAPAAVVLEIADDDPTAVTLSRSAGTGPIPENAGTAELTVTLGRVLIAGETVEVPLTVSGVSAADFSLALKTGEGVNTGVTLAAGGLLAPRVTLADAAARTAVLVFTAVQDDADEGASETATVTLGDLSAAALSTNVGGGAEPSDDGDENTTDNTVEVVITDDDTSALVVAGAPVAVGENGGTATIAVRLGSRPSHAVTVAVSVSSVAASVSPLSLTFQPDAWDRPQPVTVTGADDDVDNAGNKRDTTVVLNPASSDPVYGALADTAVAVSVVDDDGAGVSVSKTAVTVHEDGGTDTYTVVLGSEPTHAVTVTVASGDTGAATVAPGSLVFQPSAWDEPRTVTVTGVDDSADNPGDKRDVVVAHAVSSPDAAYQATPAAPVSVTVVDDDGAGVNVSKAAVSVAEGGASDTYEVVLGSQPTHAVTVTVTAGAGATVNKSAGVAGAVQTLSFTVAEWSTAQTVTVAAVDDSADQGTGHSTRITHAAASSDPRYSAAPVAPVNVAIADDDPLPVATLHLAAQSVSESGSPVAVTARLDRPSDRAVTLTVASAGAGAVLSADKALVIAAGETTSTGTVTLDPADDVVDNADRTVTVTADASGGRGVADPVAVELTVADDEAAPVVTLRLGAASVSESGSAVAVTAVLDRVSDVDVVLAVAAAGSGFTLSGSALTVAAGQTASTGEVSITPVNDDVDNADRQATVTATVTAGRGVAAPAPVVLAITDDDGAPSVSLSVASPSVAESGSAVAVTATLSRASDADVVLTVALQGAGAVLSANKALTITAGQTASSGAAVTVIPADDDVDNADRQVTVTATVTAGRGVAAPAAVVLEIADDDPTMVTLSRSAGTGPIPENAGTAELTVTLGRALAAGETVEVPLAVSGVGTADFSLVLKTGEGVNTGVTLAAGGLLAPRVTLADAAARTAVLVFTAVQDDADEGASETATVTLGDLSAAALSTNVGGGAEPSDDGDENTTDNTVEVVITDDDTSALVVAGAPVAVGENGGTATIAVRLGSRPSHAVTVAVSVSSVAASVSPLSLTFQPDGWDRPQAVTVTGADDDVDNTGNKRDTTVVLNPASSDALYGALADVTVAVSVVDDDGAGVSVSKTAVTVHEDGGTDTYTVVLGSEPTHAVTVTVASGDTGAATVAPGSLVFAPGDWDEPRTVTVTGVDDSADNPGDKRDVVVTHAVSSSDAAYQATPAAPVSVSVVDDDGAGVNVSKAAVSVAEGGTSDTYEVVLGSQPTHAVTVTVAAGAGATVNKNSGVAGAVQTLSFTVAEWSTAQTVTVAAVDDQVDQGSQRSTRITHTAASSDPRYSATPVAPVTVAIADDDPLPVATLRLGSSSVSESGSPVAVTASLDRPSDRAVTLTVASAGAGAVLSADKALVIAAGETTSSGTVTLDPADDMIDNADRTVTVTAAAAGGRGVADPVAVELTVADDEAAPVVTLRLGAASVSESGSAVAVTATLDRVSDVDVVLAVSAQGAGFTLSDNKALTIAAGQTASTGEVSITPVNDNVDNADRQATVTATVTAGRGVAAPAPVVLAITDDDGTPSVILSVASPSVAESGSPVAVTATLSRASDEDVVLTVALEGTGAVLSANKALTITAGQTASSGAAVTVIPADDDTDNADREVTVTATVTAGRGVAAPAAVVLEIADDDPTLVTLSRSAGTGPIPENAGTAELTVTLGRVLIAGETVEVPLTVSGVSAADFSLALKQGEGVNTGVTLAAGGLLAPRVTLADAAARTAVLVFTAVQDDADEGASETATVTLGDLSAAALSTNVGGGAEPSDDGDENTTDNTVEVVITDDDTAALVVAGAPVAVGENGGTATIAVRLASRPSHAVTVAVSVSSAAATASPPSLTFQPDAWDRPQPVTVTGADDDVDNPGNKRDTTVVLNPASSDPVYGALADTAVPVSVIDDDGAGVSVSKTAVTVHEDGGTDTYTVVLGAEPTHAVTVTVASGDTGAATVAPGSLVFQPSAWDEPRTVTVTGVDDSADNPGDKRDVVVAHAVSSPDAAYQATPAAPVSVTVVDDDGAGVNVSKAHVSVVEGGAADSYAVVLGSQPTHDVTVTVAAEPGVTVSVSGGTAGSAQTLVFPVSEWSTAQAVIVAAVDDEVDQGAGRSARITHAAASSDPRYGAAPVAPVTAAIADDDPLPVATLHLGAASVSESGPAVAVTARLDRPSNRPVTLTVSSSGAGAALSDARTLTIAAGATTSTGTVALDPADDGIDNADRTVTVTAAAAGGHGVAAPAPVELTVTDDEAAPVATLVLGSSSVSESGAAVAVTATLSRASDVDVVLAVAAAGTGFTLSGNKRLTIAAGQTTSTGDVSITPTGDDVDNADREVTVTATVTGRGVASPAPATLTITDDDAAPTATLSVASSVAEGGAAVPVTATLSHASDVDVVLAVGLQGTGAALSALKTLTISAGQTASTGDVSITPVDDDIDNSDREVTVTASVTAGRGVAAPVARTLKITDDEATVVTLSGGGTVSEADTTATAEVTVSLGRALAAGETVEVPLSISGAGIAATDFTLALKSGTGVNTGITLADPATLAPAVTFVDAGAQTAVLVFTAAQGRCR